MAHYIQRSKSITGTQIAVPTTTVNQPVPILNDALLLLDFGRQKPAVLVPVK